MDVILVPINFVDRFIYGFEKTVLSVAREHNVGIVAMKVFGGPDPKSGSWGTRKAKPLVGEQRVELAIHHALSVPGVATANLGVHTPEQIRENVAIVKRCRTPSRDEEDLLLKLGTEMAKQWGPHWGPVDEPPPEDVRGVGRSDDDEIPPPENPPQVEDHSSDERAVAEFAATVNRRGPRQEGQS